MKTKNIEKITKKYAKKMKKIVSHKKESKIEKK